MFSDPADPIHLPGASCPGWVQDLRSRATPAGSRLAIDLGSDLPHRGASTLLPMDRERNLEARRALGMGRGACQTAGGRAGREVGHVCLRGRYFGSARSGASPIRPYSCRRL